ncbi:MAG: hypothetical protein EXR77_09640 [Myxococcales bacterium]|nr:hypothetical protein [Myxococcales bacterium]
MQPNLTFFVELAGTALAEVASPTTLAVLAQRQAQVSMAIVDCSVERATLIRRLNAAGIAVTAWLVVPAADGYWLSADNATAAVDQWRQVLAWSRLENLHFSAVGLDIEPPHADTVGLVTRPFRAAIALAPRLRPKVALAAAHAQYRALVAEIAQSIDRVEAYHVPLILDERRAKSQLLRRALGLVDIAVDREVLMLYRSALPVLWGRGLVAAYGPDAQAIAVGITGGGVASLQPHFARRELDLPALLAELRTAARSSRELYVFSLEGCLRRGMLDAVCAADLLVPAGRNPNRNAVPLMLARKALQLGLKTSRWLT